MPTATPQPGLFDTEPDAEPLPLFELRHRPLTGGRWKRVATVATHAQAVALIRCAGDWWIVTATNDEG